MSVPEDKINYIKDINEEVERLHKAHYNKSVDGLIDKTDAPNSNTIYHLYSDGEVTYQKGSWAYLQRSEFTSSYPLYNDYRDSPFVFPKSMSNGITYAILTNKECRMIREKMEKAKSM